MRSFKLQVPADISCLITLLQRLRFTPGTMRAARIKGDLINVWFESFYSPISRVKARLVAGKLGYNNVPARVYLDIQIQWSETGSWTRVSDKDYREAGMKTPWQENFERAIFIFGPLGKSNASFPWTPEGEAAALSELTTMDGWTGPYGKELSPAAGSLNRADLDLWEDCPLPSEQTAEQASEAYTAGLL